METQKKVGVREFRAGLAEYVDSETPIAITRHGRTVGYFIPTRVDHAAEIAALKSAAAKLDQLLDLQETDVEVVVEEFAELRRKATP